MKPKLLSKTKEYSNPYFQVNKKTLELYKDNESLIKDYYTLSANNFVIVLAETNKMFLTTEQYRPSQEKLSMEFVGGFIDEGETAENAGKRELLEESGYYAKELFLLGTIAPMVSKADNVGYIYYTDDLVFQGKQLEQTEEFVGLTSKWVNKKTIKESILNGKMFDATTLAVWTLYNEYK